MEAALERVRPEIEKAEARLRHMDMEIRENINHAPKNAETRIELGKRDEENAVPEAHPDGPSDKS